MGVYSSIIKRLDDIKANFSARSESSKKLGMAYDLRENFKMNPEKSHEYLDREGTKENLRRLFENFDAADYERKLGERSGYVLYDPATNSLKFRVKAGPKYRKINSYLKEVERRDFSHAEILANYIEDELKGLSINDRSYDYRIEADQAISRLRRFSENKPLDNWSIEIKGKEVKYLSQENIDDLVAWYRNNALAMESAGSVVSTTSEERLKRFGFQVANFHYHPGGVRRLSKADLEHSRNYTDWSDMMVYKEGNGAGIACYSRGEDPKYVHIKLYEFPVFSIPEWIKEVESGDYSHLNDLINIAGDKRISENIDGTGGLRKNGIMAGLSSSSQGDKNQRLLEACHEYRTKILPEVERLCFRERDKLKRIRLGDKLRAELETSDSNIPSTTKSI